MATHRGTLVEAPAVPWDTVALALARRRPEAYSLVAHGLRPAPHHRRWLAALRETIETPGARLLLIAPPGTAKSTYTSVVLPLWYLGNHPERAVLATTSSDVMASEFHGVVELALRANEAHQAVFPAEGARPDPQRGWSSDGLYLRGVPPETKDPSYRVAGLGSSVIGSRCHLLLIDDPVTQETAQSDTEMRRVRRYLDLTLLTRLHPGGSAIAIMTRWGEADVAAHLIAQGWRAEVWPQLSTEYPGPGGQRDSEGRAPLWPARYPLAWVREERTRLGTAQFELIHQGNPLLMGGAVWRSAAWFRTLPPHTAQLTARGAPFLEECVRCTYVDTAWSEKQTADYTAAVTCAYHPADPARCLYVLGIWRRRIDQDGLADALAEHLLAVRPHVVGVELAAYKQAATQALVSELVYRTNNQLATTVRALPSVQDKVTRARPAAAKGEAGLLCLDKALPEAEALIRECFPGDTPVQASDIRAVMVRPYTGDLVVITTPRGVIEVTPEHPIWTQEGWCPAAGLTLHSRLLYAPEDATTPDVHTGAIGDLVRARLDAVGVGDRRNDGDDPRRGAAPVGSPRHPSHLWGATAPQARAHGSGAVGLHRRPDRRGGDGHRQPVRREVAPPRLHREHQRTPDGLAHGGHPGAWGVGAAAVVPARLVGALLPVHHRGDQLASALPSPAPPAGHQTGAHGSGDRVLPDPARAALPFRDARPPTRDHRGATSAQYEAIQSLGRRTVRDLPVYNLTTGSHTYLARGYVVHNCLALPVGEHDDLADALSGAAAMCLYGVEQLTQGWVSPGPNQRLRFG